MLEPPMSVHLKWWVLLPHGVRSVHIDGRLLTANFAFGLLGFLAKPIIQRINFEIVEVIFVDTDEVLEAFRHIGDNFVDNATRTGPFQCAGDRSDGHGRGICEKNKGTFVLLV